MRASVFSFPKTPRENSVIISQILAYLAVIIALSSIISDRDILIMDGSKRIRQSNDHAPHGWNMLTGLLIIVTLGADPSNIEPKVATTGPEKDFNLLISI